MCENLHIYHHVARYAFAMLAKREQAQLMRNGDSLRRTVAGLRDDQICSTTARVIGVESRHRADEAGRPCRDPARDDRRTPLKVS